LEERRRKRSVHVGVLGIEDEACIPAIPGEEIVLVPETVGPPLQRRRDRHADAVPLAIEYDVAVGDGVLRVVNRDVLEAELVLARRPKREVELTKALVGQAKVVLEVDSRADDAQRFAGDRHVGRRVPEPEGGFDVVALASDHISERTRDELCVNRSGREH
jgi:hypothetical protein